VTATDAAEDPKPQLVPDPPPKKVFSVTKVLDEAEPKVDFFFEFYGEEYTLPARPDLVAASLLSSENSFGEGFERLMGQEQWARLIDQPEVFSPDALQAVMEAYKEHIGEDLGESRASTRSSKTTGKK
jgi:hypothetical protein